MTEDRVRDLEMEVKILSRDLVNTTNILDKLDEAVDKLTDISNNLAKLVTLQSSKIDQHDEAIRNLYSNLDKKKDDVDKKVDDINTSMRLLERTLDHTLDEKINQSLSRNNRYSDACKKDREDKETALEVNISKQEVRIVELEKSKWMTYGIAVFVVFLVSYVIPNLGKIGVLFH